MSMGKRGEFTKTVVKVNVFKSLGKAYYMAILECGHHRAISHSIAHKKSLPCNECGAHVNSWNQKIKPGVFWAPKC